MSHVLRPGTVIPTSSTHPNADFSHEVWDGLGKNADYCRRTRPAGRVSATASAAGLPGRLRFQPTTRSELHWRGPTIGQFPSGDRALGSGQSALMRPRGGSANREFGAGKGLTLAVDALAIVAKPLRGGSIST